MFWHLVLWSRSNMKQSQCCHRRPQPAKWNEQTKSNPTVPLSNRDRAIIEMTSSGIQFVLWPLNDGLSAAISKRVLVVPSHCLSLFVDVSVLLIIAAHTLQWPALVMTGVEGHHFWSHHTAKNYQCLHFSSALLLTTRFIFQLSIQYWVGNEGSNKQAGLLYLAVCLWYITIIQINKPACYI